MFFALTDEQREFDAAVRGYLADRFDLAAVRAVVEARDPAAGDPGDGHPATLWKAAAEQGWLAVLVPEEHDGLGLGLVEAQVIARALGAGVAPGPWRGTVLAAEAIRLAGSDDQRASWLPRLAAGDAVGAFATAATARGLLPAVEYGAIADVLVAPLRGRPHPGRGRHRDPARQLRRHRAAGRRDRRGRRRAARRDRRGGGRADRPRPVLVAADLVGTAREAMTRTVAYDRDRRQFGVPVGSFQAIKHALADLHVAVTLAEHAALYAAHALDARLDDAELAVSVAKAKAGDAALGRHRRDDPVPRRHRLHLGARGPPVLQAGQAAGRPVRQRRRAPRPDRRADHRLIGRPGYTGLIMAHSGEPGAGYPARYTVELRGGPSRWHGRGMPPARSSPVNATAAALLGLLHEGPMTGGQLVAAAGDQYGSFFSVTRSQVYRELPGLADAGLLRLGKQGPRASQQYAITAAGRRAFKSWLINGGGSDALRSPLVLRLLNAGSLTVKQRAELVGDQPHGLRGPADRGPDGGPRRGRPVPQGGGRLRRRAPAGHGQAAGLDPDRGVSGA